MSREEKNKRLLKRHSGNEKVVELMEVLFNSYRIVFLNFFFKNFDKLMSKNDSDMIQLEVTGEMSREEVVNMIRDILENVNVVYK